MADLLRMDLSPTEEKPSSNGAFEKKIVLSAVAASDWVQIPPGLSLGVSLKMRFTGTATAQVETTNDTIQDVKDSGEDVDLEIPSGSAKALATVTRPITAVRLRVTAHTSNDVILTIRAQ